MKRVAAPALTDAAAAAFAAAGCEPPEARAIAENLVEANLFGHDSHGIGLVPRYLDNVRLSLAVPNERARIVADHGALVSIDGRRGFGQSIGAQAMDIVIERARAHGVCVAGVHNAHHLARIGRWAEQCAVAGFASVHFVNVLSTPLVAPWRGTDARLATNPFCVGVPHAPFPLVLDYATSMVAQGKVRVAHEAGVAMDEGLLLDGEGRPTRDPGVMFRERMGAMLPFGQHKGFALAVMCEVLGGALSGGRVQDRLHDPSPMINNMLSIVFAPDRLTSREELAAQVGSLARWLRESPLARDDEPVLLPGEKERLTARERMRDGIPLAPSTCEALRTSGRRAGSDAFERLLS
jgi:uncharacterized oxidoreductase